MTACQNAWCISLHTAQLDRLCVWLSFVSCRPAVHPYLPYHRHLSEVRSTSGGSIGKWPKGEKRRSKRASRFRNHQDRFSRFSDVVVVVSVVSVVVSGKLVVMVVVVMVVVVMVDSENLLVPSGNHERLNQNRPSSGYDADGLISPRIPYSGQECQVAPVRA